MEIKNKLKSIIAIATLFILLAGCSSNIQDDNTKPVIENDQTNQDTTPASDETDIQNSIDNSLIDENDVEIGELI